MYLFKVYSYTDVKHYLLVIIVCQHVYMFLTYVCSYTVWLYIIATLIQSLRQPINTTLVRLYIAIPKLMEKELCISAANPFSYTLATS